MHTDRLRRHIPKTKRQKQKHQQKHLKRKLDQENVDSSHTAKTKNVLVTGTVKYEGRRNMSSRNGVNHERQAQTVGMYNDEQKARGQNTADKNLNLQEYEINRKSRKSKNERNDY